ncbi:MAG: glycosyltransferase family 4 protein [Sphingomonadales bacterium]
MGAKKNIWLIVIGEPLPLEMGSRALRTRLLARHLASQGNDVTWWTSDFNHFAKRYHAISDAVYESEEGYSLRFLHGRAYEKNLSIARLLNHIEIARDFKSKAKKLTTPDIIVCCLPSIELAREAIAFGKSRSIPVIIDIRDLWPDEITSRLPTAVRGVGKVLTAPLDRQVTSIMREADALIGVSDAYLSWGLNKASRDKTENDCVIPLGYPDSDESALIRRNVRRPKNGPGFNLFFSGSFNNSVDLTCLIEAVRQIRNLELSLTLCGDGENFQRWRALAGEDSRVTFTGWIQSDKIRSHAANADVGLVCYRPESLVAMPNKLFEYMSFGLPIINAIPGEAANLVQSQKIGVNYKPGSAKELSIAISKMITAPHELSEMATASGRCFELYYSATAICEQFSTIIDATIKTKKLSNFN